MNPEDHVMISTYSTPYRTARGLFDIAAERAEQTRKWGQRHLPHGTKGDEINCNLRDNFRAYVVTPPWGQRPLTWLDVLQMGFLEVAAAEEPIALRAKLIEVAATALAWVEATDNGYIRPMPEERPESRWQL